jgi:hypothetical protein
VRRSNRGTFAGPHAKKRFGSVSLLDQDASTPLISGCRGLLIARSLAYYFPCATNLRLHNDKLHAAPTVPEACLRSIKHAAAYAG